MKKIIALGAQNKTSFAVRDGKKFYVSAPLEDLADIRVLKDYEAGIREHLPADRKGPLCLVCDLHPDYGSTRLAESFRGEIEGARLVKVQHHFAHVVSCMEDNGLEEKVVGVSFDGTGYGTDERAWGGEFLVCDRKDFSREYHFKYVPQPGGDIAARQGWRMAVSYLVKAYGSDMARIRTPLFDRIGPEKVSFIREMIDKDINCPLTSSAGRLFDAVSSIAGIRDSSSYEAEAAIELEKAAFPGIEGSYNYDLSGNEIDVFPMVREISRDLERGLSPGEVSARFHNTMGEIVYRVSEGISRRTGVRKVVVSGGCFQNKYLLEYVKKRFEGSGLELFTHKRYSPTDLGISVGQAVIAASM
ncbi:MAG: hypothetical protein GF408_06500 [Candidatus Omnitrophica bacterium]|nr:hypothetical protein [Candidatus Omnitrophota bacterium]